MTVTTTSSKVVCLGNGSTTVFAFPFLIPASGQEQIIFTDTSGTQTTLVPSQYSVTGFNNPAGGTVTYPLLGPAIPAGSTLTIARILPLTQTTSISNQGAFYPQTVESALDNATMQIQQIAQGQAQALKGPIVDSVALGAIPAAAQRANQLLGFDSTGQPIAAQPSSALVSSAMQPVVDAATVAAAVGLLGIPVFVGAGTTTGSANAQVIAATTPSTFTLTAGFRVAAIPGFTNNSAMTLAVAGTGTKNVMKRSVTGPVALIGGEVVANQLANWTYDGTQYILEEQGILTNPTLYLKNSATPTPTATGDIQWDTTNKEIVVGDGATQRFFPSLPTLTAIGDLLYMSAAKIMSRLGIGTAGQVLQVNAGATAPQWVTLSQTSAVATASGTSVGFTGIPANATEVTVMARGISFVAAGALKMRIGPAGGVAMTGYEGGYGLFQGASNTAQVTDGFYCGGTGGGAGTVMCIGKLELIDAANNVWGWFATGYSPGSNAYVLSSVIALSGPLSQVSFFEAGGGTFDAGSLNIAWRQ